ncbi:MAG: DUF2071 domain-containing protein [Flavobacterium sp.]|nr:DUF2071 domain-containing protein [Flavobacterium sp.]
MTNFLTAEWRKLIMANYAVAPNILTPLLPKGTKLDIFEGKAYVSLVGFMFLNSRIFGVPIPFMGSFEEVNLRFYVKRWVDNEWRRGVVFVNETVPFKAVAVIANWLYKEHYTAIPTKHKWLINNTKQAINYYWKKNGIWNELNVEASATSQKMQLGSAEAFIFEHYFGYTKVDAASTIEYHIAHPSWEIYPVEKVTVRCNFGAMYGANFAHLSHVKPNSIMLAEGSDIAVKWKRNSL